MEIVY